MTTVWTVGHSSRPLTQFEGLLLQFGIEAIADVRRFPGSRRQPQYARDPLEISLRAQNISYVWLPQLGGRRRPVPGSTNTAWRNASFQGYADHMATAEFAIGLSQLIELAQAQRTAVMCAERLWWRCHRALVADVLCVRGFDVQHILEAGKTVVHPFTSPARVVDGQLSYAPEGVTNATIARRLS